MSHKPANASMEYTYVGFVLYPSIDLCFVVLFLYSIFLTLKVEFAILPQKVGHIFGLRKAMRLAKGRRIIF